MKGSAPGDREMEALMGEKLKFIGGLMEEDEPEGSEEPSGDHPVAVPGNRGRALLLVSLGLAASAVLCVTLWAPWSSSGDEQSKLSQSGIVACSKLIVQGTVSGVEPVGDQQVRVRLNADAYVKPSTGPQEVEFFVPEEDGAAYKEGARVLVSVSRFDDEIPMLFTGPEVEPTREWMEMEAGRPDAPVCPGRG